MTNLFFVSLEAGIFVKLTVLGQSENNGKFILCNCVMLVYFSVLKKACYNGDESFSLACIIVASAALN